MVPRDDTTGYSSGPVPSAALLEKLVLWEKLALGRSWCCGRSWHFGEKLALWKKLALLVVNLGGAILFPRAETADKGAASSRAAGP